MRDELDISDDSLDENDSYDLDSNDLEDLGFISTQKNTRRNVRQNIEEMLESRRLQRSMKEVFDDDF
ncbi:PA3496 family putative envelope integrity protein [Neptunomonas japonica]|uniref:PA3496 family putative envelope integrity protein n=1 Tax=Neptunomonas japonica TaxID=417574 RepID=UPI00041A1A69|nr:hypothetical protein [Neptunomonas japonica]